MFLLGAGASVEAGLPVARELTTNIIKHFEESEDIDARQILSVLQYVLYGLLFEDSRQLGSSNTVDIERLLNAVGTLAIKDDLDLDAFVSTWDPTIYALNSGQTGQHSISSFNTFLQEFDKHRAQQFRGFPGLTYNLYEAFRTAVVSVSPTVSEKMSTGLFKRTVDKAVLSLKTLLDFDKNKKLDYLNGLKAFLSDNDHLVIASLNYDQVIEQFCLQEQISVDNGLQYWGKEFEVKPPHAGIFLIKLHGSLEWELEQNLSGHFKNFSIYNGNDIPQTDEVTHRKPAIIFGQRDKLTAEGPFLDLLRTFRDELFKHRHLVIAGYSFRDPHINAYIRYWLAWRADTKLTIIDPEPNQRRIEYELDNELFPYENIAIGPQESRRVKTPNPRITLIRTKIADGLTQIHEPKN